MASPQMVELLGCAGLDFVRIDLDGAEMNLETVQTMIYAAHAVGVPPVGECHAGPRGFSGGWGQMSAADYGTWALDNVILSVQVETRSAVEAIDEIVTVPGVDMVQSGRGDLSYQYGVPGQRSHPLVLGAERRVVEAGLKAGKLVSVHHFPLRNPGQVDTVREWIALGVQCLSLGADRDVVDVYRRLLLDLRPA